MAAMEPERVLVDFDWKDVGWRPVSPLNPEVDVRVREPLRPSDPADLWLGAASLEDIMGATLVTYDEHLDPVQVDPIVPKAVYLRYNTVDPVTQAVHPVVVPAQLTLDAYADPSMFWQPFEEELEEEEEPPDEEMEDRRKLRSSIKGDPILLRAKPAPPPEAYIAPYRYEKVCVEASQSSSAPSSPTYRRVRQLPLPEQLEGPGTESPEVPEDAEDGLDAEQRPQSSRAASTRPARATPLERAYGSRERPAEEREEEQEEGERRFFSRCVEATATMSSFQKASGRDKYGCSRLRELDRILSHRAPPVGRIAEDRSLEVHRANRPHMEDYSKMAAKGELEAHLAMHIQRMPCFHGSHMASEATASASQGAATPEIGDGSAAGGGPPEEAADIAHAGRRASLRKKIPRPVSPVDGASGSSQIPISGLYDALLAVKPDAGGKAPQTLSARRPRRDAGGRPLGGSVGATVRLRDLDPHLHGSETAPTQHLHSNWPDGLKRKVARHFYGMTHAEILMEEHRERMRDHRRRTGAKENGAEQATESGSGEPKTGGDHKPPLSSWTRPQAQATRVRSPREMMAPGGPAHTAHGLEIRIPNTDQPSVRVVVSRQTQRVRRKEESAGRPTLLPDKLSAEPKRLSRKY